MQTAADNRNRTYKKNSLTYAAPTNNDKQGAERSRDHGRKTVGAPAQAPAPPGIEFTKCVFATRVTIPVAELGKNAYTAVESYLASKLENKCSEHGYIVPKSFSIQSRSLPKFHGRNCYMDLVCQCNVFLPWVGMELKCKAESVSKAGVTAYSADVEPSPFQLVLVRDQCYNDPIFQSIQKGDTFIAKVIGIKFELNDAQIHIVADPVAKL